MTDVALPPAAAAGVRSFLGSGATDMTSEVMGTKVLIRRVQGAAATEAAERKARAGEALSAADVSELANARIAVCGLLAGAVERVSSGGITGLLVRFDHEAQGDRAVVATALESTWAGMAGNVVVARRETAGIPLVLAGVAILAVAGMFSYVFRDLVPHVIASWSAADANEVRRKALLKADQELADLAAAHLAAEVEAKKVLPVDAITLERARSLADQARAFASGVAAYVPGKQDASSWPVVIAAGTLAVGVVGLLVSGRNRRALAA